MPAADQSLLQNGVLIAGTILLVIIGMVVIKFARLQARSTSAEPVDLLEQFREAYEAGEMDTGEFQRIRDSLGRPRPASEPPTPTPGAADELTAPEPSPADDPGMPRPE